MRKVVFITIVIILVITFSGCGGVNANSAKSNDWKVISGKGILNKMSYDGDSRGSTVLEGNKTVEYSLRVPESWILEGTFFTDSNNKIAEIAPVVLLSPGEEAKFLDYKTDQGIIISKEAISFAEYKGTKVILQTDTESGSWYPHMYLLSDGSLGFTFTIYSHNQIRNETEEKRYDEIVQTVKFRLED